MTDYLIKTDGTSSGLTLGSAISDTDAFEVQQAFSAPATTLHQTFAATKTWIKSWIAKSDVGLSLTANRHSGYVVGRWYRSADAIPIVGATMTNSIIQAYPFIVPQTITVSDLAARVGTAQATKNIQFAIYANNASTCRPTGNALSSTSSISVAATGDISAALGANVQLVAGTVYWLASNTDATSLIMSSVANNSPFGGALIGSSTLADIWNAGQAGSIIGVSAVQTFGTWPDLSAATFTVVSNANTVPILAFKVASVP